MQTRTLRMPENFWQFPIQKVSICHIRLFASWAIELQYSRRVRTVASSICNRDWVYAAEGVIIES